MKSYDAQTKIMKSKVCYDSSHPKTTYTINISEDKTDINENCIFREAGSEGDMMADHSSNNTPEVGKITYYFSMFYPFALKNFISTLQIFFSSNSRMKIIPVLVCKLSYKSEFKQP